MSLLAELRSTAVRVEFGRYVSDAIFFRPRERPQLRVFLGYVANRPAAGYATARSASDIGDVFLCGRWIGVP